MELDGQRILITGANGFVGSRLCERLYLERDPKVTAVVRNMGKAARIGRLGIRIVRCDILDRPRVAELIQQSDIVIHLAWGGKRTTVDGTKIVTELARKSGIKRFIHMSSAAVYGIRPGETHTTEDAPLKKTGNPYSDTKLEAERIVSREMRLGLPAVILRPRIIYGPYSFWVTKMYSTVVDDRFILVNDGIGACNTVFIDNLIDAIILSIVNDQAVGETFFITDDEQITWRKYYETFLAMTGRNISFVSLSSEGSSLDNTGAITGFFGECKSFVGSRTMKDFLSNAPLLRSVTRAAFNFLGDLPADVKMKIKDALGVYREEKNVRPFDELLGSFDKTRLIRESGTGFTSVDKAKRLLNYCPRVSFVAGSELTKEWLRFVRLI